MTLEIVRGVCTSSRYPGAQIEFRKGDSTGMKLPEIAEQSESRIRVLFKIGWWWAMGLWVATVAMLLFLCPDTEIRCERSSAAEANCRIERKLFGFSLSSRAITGVTEARVIRSPVSRRRDRRKARTTENTTYQLALISSRGEVGLDSFTDGRDRHEQAANSLNQFLRNQEQAATTVVLPAGPWLWGGWGFLAFVTLGFTIARPAECLIDKERDMVRIYRAGFPRGKPSDYRLSDIEQFVVLSHPTSKGAGVDYNIGMRLRSGDELPFKIFGTNEGLKKIQNAVSALERFRKAPYRAATGTQCNASSGAPTTFSPIKRCILCGEDCTNEARLQDDLGNYYHAKCYDRQPSV
jgi:hypothetical protein